MLKIFSNLDHQIPLCTAEKLYQIPTSSRIPNSSYLERRIDIKAHLSASILRRKTSKASEAEDSSWNVLSLLNFDPSWAHTFGKLKKTKKWGVEKDFAQGKWWDSVRCHFFLCKNCFCCFFFFHLVYYYLQSHTKKNTTICWKGGSF